VDDIVCAVTPEPFYAVGVWYDDFSQTTDDEVRELLEAANRQQQDPQDPIEEGSGPRSARFVDADSHASE
jgi:hypothetical protein